MRIAVALLLLALPLSLSADTPLPLMSDLSGNSIFNLRVSEDLLVWQDEQAIQILNLADGSRKPPLDGDMAELARTGRGYALLYYGGEATHVRELDRSGNTVADTVLPLAGVVTAIAATQRRTLVVSRNGEAVFLDALVPFRVAPEGAYALTAAAGNDVFLISWFDGSNIAVARVSAEGVVSAPILLGGAAFNPFIASDGSSFLILWWTEAGELRGSVDGRQPFVVVQNTGVTYRAWWDGSEYIVLYDAAGVLYERRVSAGGAVGAARLMEGVEPMLVDAVQSRLAWVARDRCGGGDALMLRTGNAGGQPVSKGTPRQFSPALSRGTRIWAERSDRTRVYFGDGTLLSANGARNVAPVIDTSGPNALAVWTEDRYIAGDDCTRSLHGAIVTPQGSVLRTFRISDDVLGHAPPAVAWNGSHYAVVWERHSANVLVGLRIDADGNVLESPLTLTNTVKRDNYVIAFMERPSLEWDGAKFLLVWGNVYGTYTSWFPDPPPRLDVRRQYLLPYLTLRGLVEILDPAGTEPTASAGPERALIAWRLEEIRNVQLRIVTRESGSTVIQRDLGNVEGPLLSAPLGDDFVVVAGTGVFRVSDYAGVTPQAPLPQGAMPSDVHVEGESVYIAYTLNHRAYVRVLTTESRPGRRRSVGR
ncbi:MAG: hypothetical protein QOJ98_1728 [Acidobacteriota bacterium]|jgi:hypothetical protein|nr:hypothetical protein [Acidobacteriota bacterium]